MRLPITPQTTVLRELRDQVRQHAPAGRVIVAVDGFPDAHTETFAAALADVFREDESAVFHASMAQFLLPRALRGAGEVTPESFDLDALRRVLLDPFRDQGDTSATTGFQLGVWDWRRDQPLEARWVTAPADAVLIVDGPFLLAAQLRGAWNFAITLELSDAALAARPGRSAEHPYTDIEFASLQRDQPLRWAHAIIDVTDPAQPSQVYRDFC